jgi:hypothetical protein
VTSPRSVRRPRRSHQGGPGPGTAPFAYFRTPGRARPLDGDAVRRSVSLTARAAAPAFRNVRAQLAGPRGLAQTTARTAPAPARIGAKGVGGGGSPTPAMSCRGRGTAPGPRRRLGAVAVGPSPGPARGDAWRAAPPGRTAGGSGGGGSGVGRRRHGSRRAAGLRPLAASESAAAPRGLSPMDTQPGVPTGAS